MTDDRSATLIRSLTRPSVYGADVVAVELIETHISWVLLTGRYAYKIKKPVNLGFLDFSTLDKRRRFCEEELRLNGRLAPKIYLDVVPITGTANDPHIGGSGEPIEFAVRMRQFPHDALLSLALADGRLTFAHIDWLAREVADFHARTAIASVDSDYGTPPRIEHPAEENISHLLAANLSTDDHARISALHDWSRREFGFHRQDFELRRLSGFVRECHGDMHLGNMILDGGDIVLFDCIEFNDYLRWIDVMSETAFCAMDLEDRGRPDFAHRFLNAYLENTGDYAGLAVLRFYLVYRALVRAKVASLRLGQSGVDSAEIARLRREVHNYIELAERYTQPSQPFLCITHGFSGGGKTTGTQGVIDALGAIRIRSDVERKRLAGLDALSQSGSGIGEKLYTSDSTTATYARLAELAEQVVRAGFPVVVDATFLKRLQRDDIRRIAERLQTPFLILDFQANDETLRKRVKLRAESGRDASEAGIEVLEHQIRTQEPLGPDELMFVLTVNTESPGDITDLPRRVLERVTSS